MRRSDLADASAVVARECAAVTGRAQALILESNYRHLGEGQREQVSASEIACSPTGRESAKDPGPGARTRELLDERLITTGLIQRLQDDRGRD